MTDRPPVLVTGSHRSGSTWVGRMLAAADQLHYVQEPFNIVAHQRWMDPRPPQQFFRVDATNEDQWRAPVQRVVDLRYPLLAHLRSRPNLKMARRATRFALDARRARSAGAAALLKDPIAIFSTPWLVDRFNATAVVLVRDPVAFAGSLKERDWTFDFSHWSDQAALIEGPLHTWAADIARQAAEPGDIVEQAIVMWNAIYGFVADLERQGDAAADPIQVVSYEAIAADPENQVEALYRRLGLTFGDAQRSVVASLSKRSDVGTESSPIDVRRDSATALAVGSSRLDADEAERVRAATAGVQAKISDVLDRFRLDPEPST